MSNSSLYLILLALSLSACCPKPVDIVPEYGLGIAEVSTGQGTIAGYRYGDLFVFKGVPYGKAERFMPATMPESWEGIRPHRVFGPMCPQSMRGGLGNTNESNDWAYHTHMQPQNEDCLRLNIWTPGLDNKKRPVMIWLHGGAFSASSGDLDAAYDGTRLSRKGEVVVISVNHRLGPLGFLDLSAFGEKYKYSGNVGICDLISMLKWVRDNIAGFGGDPSNVTVFGQSGGGGKVSSIIGTPYSKGLVSKAIVESGTSIMMLDPGFTRLVGIETAKILGLDRSNIDEIQTMPVDKVISAGNQALRAVSARAGELGYDTYTFGWAPNIDGDFFPMQLDKAFASGMSKDVPLLIGSNLNEMRPVTGHDAITMEKVRQILHSTIGENSETYIEAYDEAYPVHETRDLIETDYYFRALAVLEAKSKSSAKDGAPVYRYELDYLSPAQDSLFRCPHNMEVPFAFNNVHISYGLTGYTKDSRAMNATISDAWINFAKTGVPFSKRLPEWEPFTESSWAVMILNNKSELRHHHDEKLLKLTQSLQVNPYL